MYANFIALYLLIKNCFITQDKSKEGFRKRLHISKNKLKITLLTMVIHKKGEIKTSLHARIIKIIIK
jgi:hypothetical protein